MRMHLYTPGLSFVNHGLIAGCALQPDNQLMVNYPTRDLPAPDPSKYKKFADWIKDATKQRNQKADLARFVGISAQAVQKWKGKDVPKPPILRKVASWALVDYAALARLADRSRGGPAEEADSTSGLPARAVALLSELQKELGNDVEIVISNSASTKGLKKNNRARST